MSQVQLKNTLSTLYRTLPRTGLYDSTLDIQQQVIIFLKYIKFLKRQLYIGPRSTELRRLSGLVEQVRIHSKDECDKLFKLMMLDHNDPRIDFVHIMNTYEKESDIKNAGDNYKQYLKAQSRAINDPYTPDKIKQIKEKLEKNIVLMK